MPLTGLAPLDSSWQPARFFVINDRRLQANRVDHRSFAGFSLHNLGSGQQVAAGARRRGRRSAHRSAVKFSCSGGATMCWMGSYRVSGEGTDRDHEILMTRQLTYIWLQRPASRAITATVLETRGMALETSHGVCCTQWLRCLQDKVDHVSGANSSWPRVTVRPAGSKDSAAQPT